MRVSNRLTALAVSRMKDQGRYGDGGGLYLQVGESGAKAWLFRFMLQGRARQMGLGPVHTVTLAEARQKATQCRKLLLDGVDPIDAKHSAKSAARLASAKALSFRDCAEQFIRAHQAGWRNLKHAAQWGNSLATYAYPTIGALPVDAIDTSLILKVLEPIWTTKTETAVRVRGRVESVLDWAGAREYRTGENPARWRGHLDKLLPAKNKVARVKHHAAMPYAEIPTFIADLRRRESVSARALEFTILTAARTGEVIGASRSEFDLKAATWTVPAIRMKSGREHRVPLVGRAVAIIKKLPVNANSFGLSNMAMLEMLRGMTGGALTVHGFRSAFRDWAAETTAYPNEMCEMALAHVVSDKVEAAYRRGDLFEKRRQLMTDWANFCGSVR